MGDNAKSYIMANEDVLKKVTNYLMHTNTKLQMAAVVCFYNLAYIEEPGAGDRQTKLREVGVHKILGQLLNTPDANLLKKQKQHINSLHDVTKGDLWTISHSSNSSSNNNNSSHQPTASIHSIFGISNNKII